ncbi:hypothetical protein E2C01_095990 [Portunus trituberculatus]|uniref:Uncharacterized protein n=1 Tax=Portunus trituberculatus TaxID=210409 RepID=A0A5B7K732_PORTR|nr:hypothetical protein [Portunus trituberculatus]
MQYVTVSPTPTMDGGSDSDVTVSNSAISPERLTSTPRVSRHLAERQLLNESGTRRALELTVSTIIENKDSDVLGPDTDIGGSTTEREDIPPTLPATPIVCILYVFVKNIQIRSLCENFY